LVASHLIHAWAEAHYHVPVTAFTRYLPLYFPLKGSGKLISLGSWIGPGRASRVSSPHFAGRLTAC